ncbi:MAG: GNAT family N-acetyltransferase [Ilumatobacteraceae bacterium]
MIDPNVRPASTDDVAQLAWLEQRSRAALVGQRGGDRWLETHPERASAWQAAVVGGGVLVAHIDEVVVGYLVVAVRRRTAMVDDVFVLDEARELGFGDALLAAALAHARVAGATLLEGEALPGDRNTKNLYERAGITARLITVSTPL